MFNQVYNLSGFRTLILLLLVSGAAALLISSASAGTELTISVDGNPSYYLGEKIVLRGMSPDADTVYLFMTGPNRQETGVKLTSPDKAVVSGNPDSFTIVKTKPDKTWEYTFYTANLPLDAGTYTIYVVSQPKAMDQLGPGASKVGVILKKPFITAKVSSSNVVKGQPFAVTGIAEGIPPEVRIWIIGNNNAFTAKSLVNSDASFTFTADASMSGKLPTGQNYLLVQHPMADNQYDFVVSGDYVRNLKLNNGTNLFKLSGSGSLQGSDAVDTLITAISDQEANDTTLTNDMYTLVPFQVTDAASPPTSSAAPLTGASTGTGVSISADEVQSYYLGEKVVFRGYNTDSDSTYLFLTGPNLPEGGVKLTSPNKAVVSGNPDSFTIVKTKPDKTWEYTFYTANLPFDAGTYSVYAASQPKTKDPLGPGAVSVGIILKKPFITAAISPLSVTKGQVFSITGTAEGEPQSVQIWIIGNNYAFTAKNPVNQDASFTFTGSETMSGSLPAGQYYLFVQHPMQNTQFDIDVSGDYVRNIKPNNGTNLFRLTGPGSLQGSDAADALITAISDHKADGGTLTDDTYTMVPFQITDAGSLASGAPSATTIPFKQTGQNGPLEYAAPIGAGALVIVGIVIWKRH
jgi:hypothetical protein